MTDEYFAMEVEDALRSLGSSEEGILQSEALRRASTYGPNEITAAKKVTWFNLFVDQFANPLMLLLVFACLLSFAVGETLEAVAILCIMLLNAVLGFFQEYRAERAMDALKHAAAPVAKVLRGGDEIKLPARELVPGDVILLEAGDIVPADARIFEASGLKMDESALTGESVPSEKSVGTLKRGIAVNDQDNMIFSGTSVVYGKCTALVTATGNNSEFGKIAASIRETKEEPTPLQRKFEMLAKQIGIIVVVLVAFVLLFGALTGKPMLGRSGMLFFALALTVSTIPNSLPVIVMVGLSMGANRLAKKNMLVKKLAAAESLGSATIICTDKTGTLTKNEMTITDVYADGRSISVSGSGYDAVGEFNLAGKAYDPGRIELLLRIGVVCNNAELTKDEATGQHQVIGDPTEGALLVLSRKAGINHAAIHEEYPVKQELSFDSDRKRMSVIVKNTRDSKTEAYVKGAPDLLLDTCDRLLENGRVRKMTPADRRRILAANLAYAERALRVLGFAYRDVGKMRAYSAESVERDLVFVGLVGMMDPPRDEVPEAVRKCHAAGIKVMMITGDHAVTATAIAKRIGIWETDSLMLTGEELSRMDDAELASKIERVRIVARAMPVQKVRIVDALKRHGHIVAMTGDGVNDAPALKRADIGIAMGSGSDVAREVAKGTLVDDNFSSIVNAIEEGRNIYDKILKSARYLLSCNAGEITAVFIAIAMAFPLPLLPLQLLLMNLLTDDVPALGLGTEPPDDGIMERMPRSPSEHPIDTFMLLSIAIFGLIMGLGTMYVFLQWKDADLPRAQTMAFTTLVMIEMFAVISARSLYPSWKKLNPFTNWRLMLAVVISVSVQLAVIYWPPLQRVFSTVALTSADWAMVLIVSLFGFIGMEISKLALWWISKRRKRAVSAVSMNA